MTMEKLVETLNKAAKAYYSGSDNIMSDKEYDALYDQLVEMEAVTGIILPDSPTQRVGYEVVSSLEKVTHEYPALSLDKTKEVSGLVKWLGEKECVVTPKCDGLTLVLTYEPKGNKAVLVSAVTRGNGLIGENVIHNVKYIKGIPLEIPYFGKVIVRGEVVISYQDFEEINEEIEKNGGEPYKNPRNLASGSLRLFDSFEASKRKMHFQAFTLVNPYVGEGGPVLKVKDGQYTHHYNAMSMAGCFEFLDYMGFDVVPYKLANKETLEETMQLFDPKESAFPMDGLVLTYNQIDPTLGTTGKYPRYAMAFKWADETRETTFRHITWSASKTGLINPVAEFDPVELEGTMVARASVHNLTMLQLLEMLPGDTITVYKANMIIPQIDKNLSAEDREPVDITDSFPKICPICGEPTTIKTGKNGSLFLYCENKGCPAKHLGKFERIVCRDALNVMGLSTALLEKFLSLGYLREMADIFHLDQYEDEIVSMEGFGRKSYDNLMAAIEKARVTTFRQMFYALGIPGAGKDVAKILDAYFSSNKEYAAYGVYKSVQLPLFIIEDLYQDLDHLEGIGQILADAMFGWFAKKENFKEYLAFLKELDITDDKVVLQEEGEKPFTGKTFVITGSLKHYANRNALKAEIESLGGKVSGSVSKKTTFLICNEDSGSSKAKKAAEYGTKILKEEDYLRMKDSTDVNV